MPRKTIYRMRVGQIGFVPVWSVLLTSRGKLVVDGDARYSSAAFAVMRLAIERTETGVKVYPKTDRDLVAVTMHARALQWGERSALRYVLPVTVVEPHKPKEIYRD